MECNNQLIPSVTIDKPASTMCDGNGFLAFVERNGETVVDKWSQCIDYTIELEYVIGQRINTLNSPHFCKYYELVKHRGDSAHPGLLMERINGRTLYNVDDEAERTSATMRALVAVIVLEEEFGIVHNDLRRANILVRDTDADVDAYIFPDGEEYAFATFGVSPVIIDFGCAYPGDACTTMLTIVHSSSDGLFPHEGDKVADARRLTLAVGLPYIDGLEELLGETDDDDLFIGGYYNEGTFLDFYAYLFTHFAGRVDDDMMSLLTAHCPLPLSHIKCDADVDDALATLDQFDSHAVVKHLLNNDVAELDTLYSRDEQERHRLALVEVVKVVNNLLCPVAAKESERRRKLEADIPAKRGRDVLRFVTDRLDDVRARYHVGAKLRLYDVASRTTYTTTLTADDFASGCATLKSIRDRMVQSDE